MVRFIAYGAVQMIPYDMFVDDLEKIALEKAGELFRSSVERSMLEKTLRGMRRLFRRPHLIVLCGCGGTGKTTAAAFLAGRLNRENHDGTYEVSNSLEKFRLDHAAKVGVEVVPGQLHLRKEAWRKVLPRLQRTRTTPLIINVVSWGYHAIADDQLLGFSQYERSGILGSAERYAESRRAAELVDLHELSAYVLLLKRDVRMITLVAKQDLWWESRPEVKSHYVSADNDYRKAINSLRDRMGAEHFRHEFCSVSFGRISHRDPAERVIFSTAGGYDDKIQNANLRNFQSIISGMYDEPPI